MANSARRSEFTTSYKDASGRMTHAATHLACNGKGCEECNDLGFTKTYDGKPGKGWTDEQPSRLDSQAQQVIKTAAERG